MGYLRDRVVPKGKPTQRTNRTRTILTATSACPQGQCLMNEVKMTNPGTKVVEAVKALKADVEKAADDMIAETRLQSERTKDGFNKVKNVVLKPWQDANDELEDFVNQLTNGGPPLDE